MTGRGRPIRFVALVGASWIAARAVLVWPLTAPLPDILREVFPFPQASRAAPQPARTAFYRPPDVPPTSAFSARSGGPRPQAEAVRRPDPSRVSLALLGMVSYGAVQRDRRPTPGAAPPPAIEALPRMDAPSRADRWSASLWGIARSGASDDVRLGGSQAGLRVRYRLDRSDRLALSARVATPLSGPGAEAGIGIEWRPSAALPVAIIAEQRFGIDGARGGPALLAAGGVDAEPIAAGFVGSAYAQAGAVARDGIEPFVDAAVRVARPVAAIGRVRVEAGAGAWGAAQRGAGRLDLGPGVAALVPVGGRAVRVGLDWRARVAGDAAPGSGIALSLGADF